MNMNLKDYRDRIDGIDDRIAELLEQRFRIVGEIAGLKAQTGTAVFDPERENEVINRINQSITDRSTAEYILDAFCQIMDSCKQYQSSLIENIVLIGMPGCGKTTIGRALSDCCGYTFVDADSEFERHFNKSAAEYIREYGEARFRSAETEILETFGPRRRTVYALGGGVVTVPDNFELVRPLGTVIYIRTPIEQLDVSDRPLSQTRGNEALLTERAQTYELWADICVDNTGIEQTAAKIAELLK